MAETVRIRTTPNGGDKYVKLKIDQDFDFIEVLSLKISQEEAYRNFCSDYGAVVGRVVINNGFGLPNARVSIFIPIDEDDKKNSVIKGLYPYEVISDRNSDGIKYNLLPKTSETNNDCFTPVGTFPNKREILDNPELEYVYCKYYKFTTTTNSAGDFMIFGVPLGNYTIHVDADISDIGIVSQRPYDLISQGTPLKFFTSPTKYKEDKNLDKLVQIKSTNYSVDVLPFWGDTDNCEVGISRTDIDMNYSVRPCAIFTGAIFGDQEKNSVNKRCRPRKKLGRICDQTTGEGSIEMIRKTLDGTIEQFDIDGGRLIDDDGTWAYQIPMNLDYKVTDEFGNLIPSEDPNKGIPTKSSVRFRIGMDNTGGEGRLRTRAKYLVPNNPQNSNEIDYTFDEKTKDISFRDIYWNKIYSVKSFIPRYQASSFESSRAFVGLKDVDSCGDKNPAPFNRLNTDKNPLFLIICFIIKIIAFLIYMINKFVIPLINLVIEGLNSILSAICRFLFRIGNMLASFPSWLLNFNACSLCIGTGCCNCNDILKYIPCVYVDCPFEEGESNRYAPGCSAGTKGFVKASENGPIQFYPGAQGFPASGYSAVGLDNCVAFVIAKALGMFEFDFYGDWLNGSLFGFLLKYKKKRRKTEKFCEYDCSDFFSLGGVDGNNDGDPDNKCLTNYILDTCYSSNNNPLINSENCEKKDFSTTLKEGVIKKVNIIINGKKVDEIFYYASTKHDVGYKLFATDIVSLGSVFDCDWQGVPKIEQYLTPTSYKIPPDTVELKPDGTPDVTGMVGLGGSNRGLFFNIDCKGLRADYRQILNIRHICEFGVDLDEARPDASGNEIAPNAVIGKFDIDETYGKWFRDVFFYLNKDLPIQGYSYDYSQTYSTDFNINNDEFYPFASNNNYNGQNYLDFRGYPSASDTNLGQPSRSSYFFYFGLTPGKTAVDKLKQRFFTTCYPQLEKEFNVLSSSNSATFNNPNGSLTFSIVSGTAPFTYIISGPNGYTSSGNIQLDSSGQPIPTTLNLPIGTYEVQVIDGNGNNVTVSITIDGPPPLFASAKVTKFPTSLTTSDAEITIDGVGGGSGTYYYTLLKADNSVVISQQSLTNIPTLIQNLAAYYDSDGQTPPNYGYILKVTDTGNNIVYVKNLRVDGPTPITLTVNKTDSTCYDGNNGTFNIIVSGGKAPYIFNTTVPNNSVSQAISSANNAVKGTYTTNVVDDYGTQQSITFTIGSTNVQLGVVKADATILAKQCDPTKYFLTMSVQQGDYSNKKIEYAMNDESDSNGNPIFSAIGTNGTTITENGSEIVAIIPKNIRPSISKLKLRLKSNDNLCGSNVLTYNEPTVKLPNTTLSVNDNSINNSKQCNASQITFKFNISHLQLNPNYTERKPYTFKFKINGYGPDSTQNSEYSEQIMSNQQEIIATLPSQSVINPNGSAEYNAIITYTITDSKGCTHSGQLSSITMPSQSLSSTITRSNTSIAGSPNNYYCKFKFETIGGLQPYNGIPYSPNVDQDGGTGYSTSNGTQACSAKPSPPAVTTITDRVGCSIVKSTS